MVRAVMAGHAGFQPVIEAIIRLAEKAAKEPRDFVIPDMSDIEKAVLSVAEADLRAAYAITAKADRYKAVDAARAKVMAELAPTEGEAKFPPAQLAGAFHAIQAKVVRWNILDHGTRTDHPPPKTPPPTLPQPRLLPPPHDSPP